MPCYAITEKAGRFVAGQTNTGVGSVLTLTEKQAEHEVRLGSLRPLDTPVAKAGGAETQNAPTSKGKRVAKADAKTMDINVSGEDNASAGA
ncbi:hypothetical protein [Oricola sp.]|uniref:hypothetical protein n=1 Tax=Oricola sp. TaxID=1979950 RepID=UPI0025F6406B|nr:hypothetical protein [Oricola sp.]MCI5078712.1 hypothetical protein [Oricola sp.]